MPNEKLISDKKSEYYAERQQQADYCDRFIEIADPDAEWHDIQFVQQWSSTIDAFIHKAQRRGSLPDNIDVATQILSTGSLYDVRIDIDDVPHRTFVDTVKSAYSRRLFYAHLAAEEPVTFKEVLKQDIVALHGTQASVLPSVVAANGLLSHQKQYEKNIATSSGEVHPGYHRRTFISFASIDNAVGIGYSSNDLRSTASRSLLESNAASYEGYQLRLDEIHAYESSMQTKIALGDSFLEYIDKHRFGIVFGLARKALWSAGFDDAIGRRMNVIGDFKELGFENQTGLEYLPTVFVPEQHIDVVSQQLPESMQALSTEALARAQSDAQQDWIDAAGGWGAARFN